MAIVTAGSARDGGGRNGRIDENGRCASRTEETKLDGVEPLSTGLNIRAETREKKARAATGWVTRKIGNWSKEKQSLREEGQSVESARAREGAHTGR